LRPRRSTWLGIQSCAPLYGEGKLGTRFSSPNRYALQTL
jgi:hypothetical protein